MKQVLIIHGGTTFSTYKKYINYLSTKNVQLERLMYAPGWKEGLQAKLGNNYQVLAPSMPNSTNAQYEEWKLWFDRITEVIADDVILVGHSLGGIFLAKYLSENSFPKKIIATILIAAPYDDESDEDLGGFKIHTIADLFAKQAGQVIFFHGTDDPVVPIGELEKYKQVLASAEFNLLPAPDHFSRPDFPEIVEKIQQL